MRSTIRVRIVTAALRDGLARLSDVAPLEFIVLSEETDWGFVGGDLHNAMDSVRDDVAEPAVDHSEELVEA